MSRFFNSPGIRIKEIDQSIVAPLQARIPIRGVIFIESDWGPEYALCNGNKDFIKYFGMPENIDSVNKLSYDQAFKLVGTLPLYIFRLNTGQGGDQQILELLLEGSPATATIGSGDDGTVTIEYLENNEEHNGNTVEVVAGQGDDEPLTVSYDGEVLTITLGTQPWTSQTQTIGSGDSEVEIEVVEPGTNGNNYTVEVVEGVGNDVDMSAVLTDSNLVITLGTDSGGTLDPSKNASDLVAAAIEQSGGGTVFTATQAGTDPLTAQEGPHSFTGGTQDVPDDTKNAAGLVAAAIEQEEPTIFSATQSGDGSTPLTTPEIDTFTGAVDDEKVVPILQKYEGSLGNRITLTTSVSGTGVYTIVVNLDGVQQEIYVQDTQEELIDSINAYSNYIIQRPEVFEQHDVLTQLVSDSPSELEGGANGQLRDPSFFWSQGDGDRISFMGLENRNHFQFRFVIGQGRLDQSESSFFQQKQEERKDFVVITEFVPDNETWINEFSFKTFERGIQDDPLASSEDFSQSSYLQVYHPWIYERTVEGSMVPYPPSKGIMEKFGGVIQAGRIWDTVQGTQRGQLSGEPTIILNSEQKDLLYVEHINPIVKFQGEGTYIWGQKTFFKTQSQLNRLNQRMATIELETSTEQRLRDYIFEPLTQTTFNAIEQDLHELYGDLVAKDAIIAYRFELLTEPQYLDNNFIIINVQFIPTKSLEFIELRFVVKNYSQEL